MRFTPEARAALTAEWVAPEEAIEMVRQAAKVTHPFGNRRFHDWVFQIQGDVVIAALFEAKVAAKPLDKAKEPCTIAVPAQLKPDQFLVYDDCPQCDGAGCEQCDNGQVRMVRSTKKPLLV